MYKTGMHVHFLSASFFYSTYTILLCLFLLRMFLLVKVWLLLNRYPPLIFSPFALALPLAHSSQLWTLQRPSPSLTPSTWTLSSTCWCLVRASSTTLSPLSSLSKSFQPVPHDLLILTHWHIYICPCVYTTSNPMDIVQKVKTSI